MDLKKLYDSLTLDEKKELRGYLNKDFIEDDGSDMFEWCKRHKPSVRLHNILMNNFKTRQVSTIIKKEFMLTRDAGIKSWDEFIKLRSS